MPKGQFTFPGIQNFYDFSGTDVSGISPAIFTANIPPQFGIPAATGDIVLTYDDPNFGFQTVTFRNCCLDAAFYEEGSGGQVVTCRFKDERYKWESATITGRYNIRLPNNFVDPVHEKTPQELATLCFQALNVSLYDASALPNDARPDVDWNPSNPADELAKLCDDLGCRLVCKRSTGTWTIVITGVGAMLRGDWPYQDAGSGVDPKELPDYIKIVTAPKKFQVALRLEAVAKDTNMSWNTLDQLTYTPTPSISTAAYGFGTEHKGFSMCSRTRVNQADGTKISPQELAMQTVFRYWRVQETRSGGLTVPGYSDNLVSRKRLILSDELVQSYIDDRGAQHARPAFIFGSFYDGTEGLGNKPNGTRIDYQVTVFRGAAEERASFGLTLDPIDTDRCFAATSKQMMLYTRGATRSYYEPATIFLMSAVMVRDADTWQPVRTEYFKQIGAGTNTSFCAEFVKDDIQPWYVSTYNPDGSVNGTTNNEDEVTTQCKYYADSIFQSFQTIASSQRTYIGIFPIDMDGAIQQVTYRIGERGCDTIASRGSEHNFDIPPYLERRQRDGRKNSAEKLNLLKEILARQWKMRGTFNT